LQVEGSLTFTDNGGEGFKTFGRGTEWETIKGGKTATQAAKEAEIFKLLLLQHAAAVPEGLDADLYARELAKYFPNDPPPKDGDPNAPPADPNAPRTSAIGEVFEVYPGSLITATDLLACPSSEVSASNSNMVIDFLVDKV